MDKKQSFGFTKKRDMDNEADNCIYYELIIIKDKLNGGKSVVAFYEEVFDHHPNLPVFEFALHLYRNISTGLLHKGVIAGICLEEFNKVFG